MKRRNICRTWVIGVAAGALIAAAASSRAQTPAPPQALASAADPLAAADSDMARVLRTLQELGPKPIETLEPDEARRQPTPADAVAKIVERDKLDIKPHAGLRVSDSRFADMGNLHLRFYVPENATRESNLPVILYFRGGGWVIGTLDSYDATPAALARKANAAVISVDYPLAPTEKFPAAHAEAIDAYRYVLSNAKDWGYDPSRIALVGESAGGNLAINTAIAARDAKLPAPVAIVAIHPLATTAMDTPSKREQATAKPMNTAMVTWFLAHVVRNDADRLDPRLNLVASNLGNIPPVTVINAAIDPLRSDGELLVTKLRDAGVNTTHRLYPGVTHEFFGMGAVVAKAREAQDFATSQIKRAYEETRPPVGAR